jgi:hypothetical protein
MARIKAPVVVTANHLGSGEVVYLSRDGRWQASMDAGQVFTELAEAEAALARHDNELEVVGAYLINVEVRGARVEGQHYREQFRSLGPSNYWHGKQTEANDAPV